MRKALILVMVAIVSVVCAEDSMVTCRLVSKGCSREVLINGFPLWTSSSLGRNSSDARIDHLLQRGTNIISICVIDTNMISNAKFSINVSENQISETNSIIDQTNILSWVGLCETNFAIILQSPALTNLSWIGEAGSINGDARESMVSVVSQVYSALIEKDDVKLVSLYSTKNIQLAASRRQALAEVEANQTSFFQKLFTEQNYSVDVIDVSRLTLVSRNNCNLVCVEHDGKPPLTINLDDGAKFRIPMYFSKTLDGWRLVW